jgi:hypothetical protein
VENPFLLSALKVEVDVDVDVDVFHKVNGPTPILLMDLGSGMRAVCFGSLILSELRLYVYI